MLLYTLMLFPLTLAPVLFGAFGRFYGFSAAVLGAPPLWYCVRLLRTPGVTPTAWVRHPYGVLILTSAAPTPP
jgi:heme O synthase-like polyprenyltransferase